MELSKYTKSNTNKSDFSYVKLLTGRDDSGWTRSKTETVDPEQEMPDRGNDEPIHNKLRSEAELPVCPRSRTSKLELSLARLLSSTLDSTPAKFKTGMDIPKQAILSINAEELN